MAFFERWEKYQNYCNVIFGQCLTNMHHLLFSGITSMQVTLFQIFVSLREDNIVGRAFI